MESPLIISIVGFGNVGTQIAAGWILGDFPKAVINVMDPDPGVAGAALDLAHGGVALGSCEWQFNNKDLLEKSDLIFHTAGPSVPPGASRLSISRQSLDLTREIFSELKFQKLPWIIVISNPVDLIAWQTWQSSGLPSERILGSGSGLDGLRLSYYLGQHLGVAPHRVEAQVWGEHGASCVPVWSQIRLDGKPLTDQLSKDDMTKVLDQTLHAAAEIKKDQGATYFGVTSYALSMARALVAGPKRQMVASSMVNLEELDPTQKYSCFMGVPLELGPEGVTRLPLTSLSEQEKQQFIASAQVLEKHLKEET